MKAKKQMNKNDKAVLARIARENRADVKREGELIDLNNRMGCYRSAVDAIKKLSLDPREKTAPQVWADVVDAAIAKAKIMRESIDQQRAKMPRVKWDMAAGEFFYAEGPNGDEVFAVKVRRVRECYVRVYATNWEAAKRDAEIISREHIDELTETVEVEDYSR